MSHRWIVAFALSIALPVAASAQFTTFISPPNPTKDSIKAAVVAGHQAVSDSITHAQITDMKTWVDSAAGIAALPPVDTTTPASVAAPAAKPMANGVVAPSTASSLPFVLVIGGASLILGLMLMRRPSPEPRRTDS